MGSRRARVTAPPLLRRVLALPSAPAALALTLALAFVAVAAAQETTEFKPSAVRFVIKRTTTRLPGLDDAPAVAAVSAAASRGGSSSDATPELSGARRSPADELLQESVAAALQAALSAAGGGNTSSSAVKTAAAAADGGGGLDLARLRAELAAAVGVGPPAGAATRGPASSSASSSSSKPGVASSAAPGGGVRRSWRSLNAFEAGTAVGNPQGVGFIPPDAAMAVGRGFLVACVNNAIRVYDSTTGAPRSPPVDLTVLYGLPPLLLYNPTPACGDRLVDPQVLWDPELRRWVTTMARVAQAAKCAPTGKYYVEVAVSATPSPLGAWHVYSIDASNDGGEGGSPLVPGCEAAGCFADFPRAQLDPNVLVVTANSFFGRYGTLAAATAFVLDKFALAKGLSKVALAEFTLLTVGAWDDDGQAFSLSPAYVPPRKKTALPRRPNQITGPLPDDDDDGGDDDDDGGGGASVAAATATAAGKTAAFGKQQAPAHAGKKRWSHHHKKKGGGGGLPPYTQPFLLLSHSVEDSQRLIRWVLTGTRAVKRATDRRGLDALSAALTLTASPVVLSEPVINPNVFLALQPQIGNFPFGRSLGYFGPGYLGASDFRVLSSAFAAGRLYGVFSVFVYEDDDGFLIPFFTSCLVQLDAKTGDVLQVDFLGELQEDTTFPVVAVDRKGRGAVVSMVSSPERYASVALFPIAEGGAVGLRQIALEGFGLEDGSSQYSRAGPRAGDYGTAVIEAETGDLWAASEYISAMSCALKEWLVDPTCGATRLERSNWDTGVFSMQLA